MAALAPHLRHGEWRRAARGLGRRPVYSLTVILLLGVGVGAAAAVWSAGRQVWGGALSLRDDAELVRLVETRTGPRGEVRRVAMGPPAFHAARDLPVFASVAAQRYQTVAWLPAAAAGRGGGNEPVTLLAVSDRWAETLGVRAAQGRLWTADEERAGSAARAVVVSDAFWRRRMGGSPSAVGSVLTLDGESFAVVGVLPRGFSYPYGAEVWRPFSFDPTDVRSRTLNVQARLAPGVTRDAAQAALETLIPELRRVFPEAYGPTGLLARPTRLDLIEDADGSLRAVIVAIGLLLALTLANLAALVTARALAARREVAVRAALGASGARSTGGLSREVALLVLGGLVLAVGVARAVSGSVLELIPDPLRTLVDRVEPDLVASAVAVGVALLAGLLLAGLSRRLARVRDLAQALSSGRGSSRGDGRPFALVLSVQTAVTTVLVGAALWGGLAMRDRLRGVVGFDSRGLYVASIALPADPFADPVPRRELLTAVAAAASALPGIEAAGVANLAPFSGSNRVASLEVQGVEGDPERAPIANLRVVDPGFFASLGMAPVLGRGFDATDRADGSPVAIVGRSLARTLFANEESALGRRIRFRGLDARWTTVVGVVEDVAFAAGPDAIPSTWYLPLAQTAERSASFTVLGSEILLRSIVPQESPAALTASLRAAAGRLHSALVVEEVRTMAERRAEEAAEVSAGGALLAVFALAALVLAAVGVHGTLAYFLASRTRELGVRVALGATSRRIANWLLASLARPVAWGLAGGSGAALFGWWRAAELRAEWPAIPWPLWSVPLLVTVATVLVAALGCLARARRLAPAAALHEE